MSLPISTSRAIPRIVVLSVMVLAATGCQVPSAILYKLRGPDAIPPKYVVPQHPLLLLVENAHSGAVAIPEADELARVIYDDLQEHKVAPLIDPAKVHDLRDAGANAFGKMSIAQIGQRLGAAQVLYLRVDKLDIEVPQGSEMVRVRIAIKASIIDVATAQTVWPTSGDTEPYDYESKLQRADASLTRNALNHQFLRESGQEIARWFYPYQPETMREENQDIKLR
jgi:hypothetical protein